MPDILEILQTELPPTYCDVNSGIALYQGDSKDILPKLAELIPNSVNLHLADPPYGIKYVSNHRTTSDQLGKPIANDESLDLVEFCLPYLDTLLANNSAVYMFAHPNMVGENRILFDKYWNYKNLLVWDKGDAGTFGDLKAGYSLNYENIFYYNKGRKILNGARPRTILRNDYKTERRLSGIPYDEFISIISHLLYELPEDKFQPVVSALPQDIINSALAEHPKTKIRYDWSARNDPVHPTVKSINLLSNLIKNSTDEGDLVMDFTFGSGTCAAACKALGRRFIGIEIEPVYFNIAVDRVKAQTLFPSKKTVVQETMFQ